MPGPEMCLSAYYAPLTMATTSGGERRCLLCIQPKESMVNSQRYGRFPEIHRFFYDSRWKNGQHAREKDGLELAMRNSNHRDADVA